MGRIIVYLILVCIFTLKYPFIGWMQRISLVMDFHHFAIFWDKIDFFECEMCLQLKVSYFCGVKIWKIIKGKKKGSIQGWGIKKKENEL